MVKIVFSGESIEAFLISSSMVGLGLVIAIYSLTAPLMKNMLTRRTNKLKELIDRRDDILEQMNNEKNNTKLTKEYRNIQDNVKLAEKLPFHLDLGYILAGGFFSVSLVLPILTLTDPQNQYFSNLSNFATGFFIYGVISFLIVWYLMFIEFRTYALEEFQKIKDEAKEKENTPQQRNLKALKKLLKK